MLCAHRGGCTRRGLGDPLRGLLTDRRVEKFLAHPRAADRVGIESKATAAPGDADARHLAWLRDSLGDRFVAGVLLHTGPKAFAMGDRIQAVPICCLWQ
jgi:hypothetical protein